jgi:hypothetical protein
MATLPHLRDAEPTAFVSATILAAALQLELDTRMREAEHRRSARAADLEAFALRCSARRTAGPSPAMLLTRRSIAEAKEEYGCCHPMVLPVPSRSMSDRAGLGRDVEAVANSLSSQIELERAKRQALERRIKTEIELSPRR